MARHRSNKKNNVTALLSVRQENNSRYQPLYYWMTVVVWMLSLGLLLQRFRGAMPASAASQLSPAVTLSHDNRQTSYEIQFPSLAPLLLSSAVTYQTGNSVAGVLSSLLFWFARPVAAQTSGVNIVVPEFRVNSNVTGDQQYPKVASLSTGEWMVVWRGSQTGNADIYAQLYAGNGSVIGSEFRVNSNVTGDQYNPAVVSLSTGGWVVVWDGDQTGNDAIYAQRYAANGNVLGSEFRVNSNVKGDQSNPAVASLSAGEWVVVWRDGGLFYGDIYAQRYAGNGSVLGSEFRVNSATTGDHQSPAVASLSTGEWVVVWTGGEDIYAQRYARNGSVLGSEFRLNSATTSGQYFPTVASLSSGEWVVVWQGSQTGNGDIYGSIFSSAEPLSTTPNANPVKTSAITSSLNALASSSAGMTVTTLSGTPQLVTATNANSGLSGVVIGAAVGGSVVGVAVCLGALGFYAYHKKSRTRQANHSAVNESVGTSLNTTEHALGQRPSGYVQMNVKQGNQSDNMIPVSHSRYGHIDEMKRVEKEYDHAPRF